MTRRQLKLQTREETRDQDQNQTRLAAFVDAFFPGADTRDERAGGRTEEPRVAKPASGPLSDRLQEAAAKAQPGRDPQAFLEDLDGTRLAGLPCDEAAGVIILGRGQNATVRIHDPYVHRVHAQMRWDAATSTHIIAHGGGENATYVDHRKIRVPVSLQDGARIRLGRTELIYRIG